MASHGKSPGHTLYSQATQRLGAFRRPVPLAILTLILVLAAVVGLWRYVNEASLQTAQARIDRRALRITSDALRELNVMENVLRGASGLLETDLSITQKEWRGYVSHLHLADTLPMVRALGFATANGRFAPISMMTPTGSGIPAVGFDLLGDTARHASLDRAAGTATAALHAIPGDNRVDFELYLPFYKSIEAEGRANVAGFVIAVADVERLFDTVTRREPRVELEVFSGTPATLLYSSNTFGAAAGPTPLVRKTMTLNFGGEPLTLTYSATAEMLGPNDDNASTAVLVGGTASALLLGAIVFLLARDRTGMSGATARASTQSTLNEARMMGIIRSSMEAIITIDENQRIVIFNPTAEQVFDCSAMDAIGASLSRFIPERFRADHARHVRQFGVTGVSDRQMGKLRVLFGLRANGEEFPIEASISQIDDGTGKLYTVMLRDVTERVKADNALRRSRAELRDLSENLQNVREEEKTRIARELHDDLGQQLTALKMDLSSVEQLIQADSSAGGEIIRQLRGMRSLVDKTVASLRRIAADQRPVMLDDLGLIPAIEWLANDFTSRYGINVERHIEPAAIEFNRMAATTVFRIVQEALTNVARHAEASRVTLTIRSDGGHCILRISDDGHGAAKLDAPQRRSFGLLGMRERARILGGSISIDTEPGQGFAVTVTFPVKALQQEETHP